MKVENWKEILPEGVEWCGIHTSGPWFLVGDGDAFTWRQMQITKRILCAARCECWHRDVMLQLCTDVLMGASVITGKWPDAESKAKYDKAMSGYDAWRNIRLALERGEIVEAE